MQGVAQPLVEQGAVGQIGQGVVGGDKAQLVLGKLALKGLPDLRAEGFQQLYEGFVRLNGLRAEELDNPEGSARGHDGKREGAAQPGLQSRCGPAEALLRAYVREDEGFMSRPRAAGQIDAAR